MTRPGLDERLAELHRAADQVSASLVELEIDSGRQLLDASELEGETSARWGEASQTLAELWRRHGLLDALLGEADKLRGSRHADELAAMLGGPSIELTGADVPLAERSLLGTSERCSPAELLNAMSDQFEGVKATLVQIGEVWERLSPRMDEARALLADARRRSAELGEGEAELAPVAAQVEASGHLVTHDPLRARADEIDAATERLRAVRDELERSAELKTNFERRMLEAHEELERLRGLAEEAAAARREALVKIASPDVPQSDVAVVDLAGELDAITDLARTGAWRRARRSLDDCNARLVAALDQGRSALDACRAPVRSRNELRALLETYQVKARRLGRGEDRALSEMFGEARDVLYTAPTDLALAARLVRRYQQALSGTGAAGQVTP
jgi:hypothetical protein